MVHGNRMSVSTAKLKRKEKKNLSSDLTLHIFFMIHSIQNYEWFGSIHTSRTYIECICSFRAIT